MIIKEDPELEQALATAYKSETKPSTQISSSSSSTTVGSESQRQSQNQDIIHLAQILAKGYRNKSQKSQKYRPAIKMALKGYHSLSEWEYSQSVLGTSINKAA